MIQLDKSKILSPNQVKTALRALATFQGVWWVWLRRERKGKPEEFVKSPMNLEDIENTFVKLRTTGDLLTKPYFNKFHKYLLRLLRYSGCEEALIARVGVATKAKFEEQIRRCYTHPALETSQLRTMIHGDFWLNNMMFSCEDNELSVTLLDFQQLMIAHPARDLWYFLYSSTDKQFRDHHLKDVLREYYNTFSKYLELEGVSLTFQEFCQEMNSVRVALGLGFSIGILFIALSPEPLGDILSMTGFKRFQETQKRFMARPPSDEDHPNVKELRRRMVEVVRDLDQENLL